MLRGRSRRIVVEPIKAPSPKSKPSKSVEPDGRAQAPPDSAKPPAQTKQTT
jgi:hypothetical protein